MKQIFGISILERAPGGQPGNKNAAGPHRRNKIEVSMPPIFPNRDDPARDHAVIRVYRGKTVGGDCDEKQGSIRYYPHVSVKRARQLMSVAEKNKWKQVGGGFIAGARFVRTKDSP